MSLKHSYTLIAPFYDWFLQGNTQKMRQHSLSRLNPAATHVLLPGIGTGLDIPLLPKDKQYVGIDLTPAMLNKARQRISESTIELHCGDVMQMPYANDHFDAVILHLILAVVPQPERLLAEATRVLKPGGQLLIMDKFLRPGEFAPLRRLINPFIRHIATRTDVVFESLLAQQIHQLQLVSNEPAGMAGWFRYIECSKTG